MKKLLIILIITAAIWLHYHPIGQISKVSKGLIIYSGVPIFNMDLIIKPSGGFTIAERSYKKIDHYFLIRQVSSTVIGGEKYEIVIIGQGIGELIPISQRLLEYFNIYGATVLHGNSEKMAKKYNELKKQGKKILAIFTTSSLQREF